MQECYLDADSKGIIPRDLEDRASYLVRAMNLQEVVHDEDLKSKIADWLTELYIPEGYFVRERFAPSKAINFMNDRFGCDVPWVPYYEARPMKGIGRISNFWTGLCTSYHNYKKGFSVPVVIHYHFSEGEWKLGVHELTHAVRKKTDAYRGAGKTVAELLAESASWIKLNDVFVERPLGEVIGWYLKIKTASGKLRGCFGAMSDYALIRLGKDEIGHLSEKHVHDEDVTSYFRSKANASTGLHERGKSELRFRIMCERLGL